MCSNLDGTICCPHEKLAYGDEQVILAFVTLPLWGFSNALVYGLSRDTLAVICCRVSVRDLRERDRQAEYQHDSLFAEKGASQYKQLE